MNKDIDFNKYFEYDENSPSGLVWKIDRYSGKYNAFQMTVKGEFAGGRKKDTGYWVVKIYQKQYSVHRIICCLSGSLDNYWDDVVVDHIDGNNGNNTMSNLRVVTTEVNTRNAKMLSTNKSGVNGVHYCKVGEYGGWRAALHVDRKRITKFYSDIKYGELAFKLACDWRENKIKEFGIVFSERHGLPAASQTVVQSETAGKVVQIVNSKLDEYLEEAEKAIKK